MVNTLKLKARMVEFGLTQKDIAEHLNIASSTASLKINNIRPMYLKEADLLADLLKINTEQFGEYFFTTNIAQCNKNIGRFIDVKKRKGGLN
jgi:transcriptional regulator with XRE-family HTH domain